MPRNAAVALLLALTLAAGSFAAGERDRLLVSTKWLAEHLRDPDLVLLHVGDPDEYAKAHLPGARFVAMRDLARPSAAPAAGASGPADPAELSLEMPTPEDLRQRLEALGISNGSRVVVYYGNDWVSPSTRIVFTLDYAGLGDRVSLLDGGQAAWVREGRAVTAEVPAPRAGKLAPLAVHPTVVDARFVLDHRTAPGYAVVDARDRVYYDGVEIPGRPEHKQRAGHIAGAHSLPFSTMTNDDLYILSQANLAAAFENAGIAPGDVVVGYCHIGQQATAMLFGARLLGHEVRLYDGSFEDWSRLSDYPVEVPPPAPAKAPQP